MESHLGFDLAIIQKQQLCDLGDNPVIFVFIQTVACTASCCINMAPFGMLETQGRTVAKV